MKYKGKKASCELVKIKIMPPEPPGRESDNKPRGSLIKANPGSSSAQMPDSLEALITASLVFKLPTLSKIPDETQNNGIRETMKKVSNAANGHKSQSRSKNSPAKNEARKVWQM